MPHSTPDPHGKPRGEHSSVRAACRPLPVLLKTSLNGHSFPPCGRRFQKTLVLLTPRTKLFQCFPGKEVTVMSCGFVKPGQGIQCFLEKGEAPPLVRPQESQGCRIGKFPSCPIRSIVWASKMAPWLKAFATQI